MKETKTIQYENGNVILLPVKSGLGIYIKKEKVLDLKLEDAQSLMINFLSFAEDMMPKALPATKGIKKAKSGKHKNQ